MGWATATESKSLRVLLGTWFVLTAVLLVGFATLAIERAAANEFRIASVDLVEIANTTGMGVPAAEPPADPAILPATEGAPVLYAGTTWSLVGARLIPRTEDISSRPIVVVDVVLQNVTADATTRIRTSDAAMIWPDGRRDEVDRFEFTEDSGTVTLAPGEAELVALVFKPAVVTDPVVDELTLEIGERGRIPARIPMVGPVPADDYPVDGAIDGAVAVITDPDGPGRQLVIQPRSAAVDINAGPYRSAVGSRLAVIEISVQRATTVDGAAFLQPGFWRLDRPGSDGPPLTPTRIIVPSSDLVEGGDLVTLLFVVDPDSTDMVLTAAANTSESLRYPVTLPDTTDR